MKSLKFKSNINCSGCLSKVTPILDKEEGIEKWEVDLQHDDRILTVETSQLSAEEIQNTVNKAGFRSSLIDS